MQLSLPVFFRYPSGMQVKLLYDSEWPLLSDFLPFRYPAGTLQACRCFRLFREQKSLVPFLNIRQLAKFWWWVQAGQRAGGHKQKQWSCAGAGVRACKQSVLARKQLEPPYV